MPFNRRSALFGFAALASLQTFFPVRGWAAQSMRIGVIGAGSLGGTVGRLWVQAGHEVLFSSRHPDELISMTRELGPRASVGTPRQAAEFGTVLLFAVPYGALPVLGRELKDALRGKTVLDACNPSTSREADLAREAQENGVGPTSAEVPARHATGASIQCCRCFLRSGIGCSEDRQAGSSPRGRRCACR